MIVDGAFGVARLLLNAGAQISDLDSSSVAHVLEREKKKSDRKFLITLLQRGVTLSGLNLDKVLAYKFFKHIHPKIILRDGAGKFLPKNIREERKQFIKNTAQTLNVSAGFERKKELVSWLAEFFADYQLSS